MPTIDAFDAMRIRNGSIKFQGGTEATPLGCSGTLTGETELREIVKRCEGVTVKKLSKPIAHNVTLSGYFPVKVLRDIFGLANAKLKAGVYSYGKGSVGKPFVLTADVVDEFEDITKLIAFPNGSSLTGLQYTIDNDADEVAYTELEFSANPDEAGEFYYEAFASEIDSSTAQEWHTNFSRELVEEVEA